jgi:hypothetical protein
MLSRVLVDGLGDQAFGSMAPPLIFAQVPAGT